MQLCTATETKSGSPEVAGPLVAVSGSNFNRHWQLQTQQAIKKIRH